MKVSKAMLRQIKDEDQQRKQSPWQQAMDALEKDIDDALAHSTLRPSDKLIVLNQAMHQVLTRLTGTELGH
jgi:hypothetical protein